MPLNDGYDSTISGNTAGIWRTLFARPYLCMLLCIAIAIGFATGLSHLRFSTDYRAFFSADNPQLQAFEALQDVFARDENVLIVLHPMDDDVFTPEVLKAIAWLTEEAWRLPYASRVDSLTNFQYSSADGDLLTVRDLVRRGQDLDAIEIAAIKKIALSEPLLVDRLISPNGHATGVNVTLTLPQASNHEVPEAMVAVRALIEKLESEYPYLEAAVTGVVPLNNAFSEASAHDLAILVPAMYAILAVMVFAMLRSLSAVVATLSTVLLSAGMAMGAAGWLGITITPASGLAPTIIMTLAIADCIHLLAGAGDEMSRGKERRAALAASLRLNLHPILLTSVTTAIGFLSFNFSDSPPFRDLGNITAIGVAAAAILTLTLVPALILVLPHRGSLSRPLGSSLLLPIGDFTLRRPRALLALSVLGIALATIALPQIELDDQFVDYFGEELSFRRDTDFARRHLSGIYQLHYPLRAGKAGGIHEPDFLHQVDDFSRWFRERPGVTHVQTPTETLRRLNMNMHGDDPKANRLPETRELAAQYLLLYEMSLPYGLDLNDQVNIDKSAIRVVVTLDNLSMRDGRELASASEEWLQNNAPAIEAIMPTGAYMMFAQISERNIRSMLVGTGVAIGLISLLLIAAFRSWWLGLLSLLPNIAPAIFAFGLWAILVGEINLASSVVTAASLGIVVDDTIHFLSKYIAARRGDASSPRDAIRYAYRTVGSAMWTTSLVLIAGFSVLAMSSFEINQSLGILTAIVIAMALISDLLFLPPLLLLADSKSNRDMSQPNQS